MLGFEASRLRAHFENAGAGRIVDVDLSFGQPAQRIRQLGPLFAVQVAGTKPVGVDSCLRAKQTGDKLFGGHLRLKMPMVLPFFAYWVYSGPERSAYRRPACDDDEILSLQA